MEFLRFGSSIPGTYWGCCACCIIQNFNVDPDTKSSIQLVSGDGGYPIQGTGGSLFAGPTYRDIFWQRLRCGTFDSRDMPNHAFLAILTANQINGSIGKKWLEILKSAGFEFVRTVGNSVYSVQGILNELPKTGGTNQNYIFGLFRNIGTGAQSNPFIPPKAWTDLESVIPEAWETLDRHDLSSRQIAEGQFAGHKAVWVHIGKPKFLSEAEIEKAGAPVILAGQRSKNPQEPKASREARNKYQENLNKAKISPGLPLASF